MEIEVRRYLEVEAMGLKTLMGKKCIIMIM